MYEMKVTKINSDDDKLLGIASLTVDKKFTFNSLRIIKADNKNKLFVAMPSYKTKEGDYKEIFFPISSDMTEELQLAAKRALKSKSGITKIGTEETNIGIYVNESGRVKMALGTDMICDSILVRKRKDTGDLFVAMPSYKSKKIDENGNVVYKTYCNPITADFRKILYDNILNKYNLAVSINNDNEMNPVKSSMDRSKKR